MKIGFNGRYLVYPYFSENNSCYAAHCLSPERSNEQFWLGEAKYAADGLQIFNLKDIERCEDGALFVAEGEANLLCLRELGFPGVAVPTAADLQAVEARRFDHVRTVFLVMCNTPESDTAARGFAARLGFKVRLLQWPSNRPRGFDLSRLALEDLSGFKAEATRMIGAARAYSPFRTPVREYQLFRDDLARQQGESYQALRTGLPGFDAALGGVHGINVIGGPPKSGKSTLGIQLGSEIARKQVPVIYYDFENGRQKIYQRTLARLSRLEVERLVAGGLHGEEELRRDAAQMELRSLLNCFRVITDRKLTPEIMRRHIDFLRHETGRDDAVVVIDSLHKLPFKDFAERRTGIDAWLRELESIRDELRVAFLVLSELSRQEGGRYDGTPHMGLFKGSGDIEYTADNAALTTPHGYLPGMAKKTFESALARLEQITAELEDGEQGLETSLKKFNEGIELVRFCNQRLAEARQQVDLLLKEGGALRSVPFAEDENGDQDLSATSRKHSSRKLLTGTCFHPGKPFADHIETLRYSLFAGGKRIRPILCLAAPGNGGREF
jgi:replicative DNA helicase